MGLKVRDVYEVPAAEIILTAHRELEKLVCTGRENALKPQLDALWAQLAYEGLWYEPLLAALNAFMDQVSRRVEGEITMRLYKGERRARSPRSSPQRDLRPQHGDLRRRRVLLAGRRPGLHRALLAAEPHGPPHRGRPGARVRRGGPPILPVDAAVGAGLRARRARSARPAARAGGGARRARRAIDGGAPPLRLRAGAPAALRDAAVVAGGKLVLATADAVAYSLALPQMRVVHDRRPPGLDGALGAPLANAGLLRDGEGWRAVVLPSLGDVAAGIGPGPAAIRADGRRIAAAVEGAVEEWDLGDPNPVARHEGWVSALCYDGDGGLLAAAGARVGAPGLDAGAGPAIVSLAGAAAAPRAVARHEDGSISVWERGSDEPVAAWTAPPGHRCAGPQRRRGAGRPRSPRRATSPPPAWPAPRTA